MKRVLMLLALGTLGIGVWQYYAWDSSPNEMDQDIHDDDPNHDHISISPEQIDRFKIEIRNAQPGLISYQLSTRGKIILHPDHLAHILPKVSGVAKVAYKNIGDHVEMGETLAMLESREMGDIQANYLGALEKEKLARSLLEREKRLTEKKISAEQDYLLAQSTYEEAKLNTQLTQQKLHAFGLTENEVIRLAKNQEPDLCSYEIRSPLEGTVINRHITKGEFIEDTMTIYEIANLSNVWIEIGVYPKDLHQVREGQIVHIKLPGEEVGEKAKIIYVSPVVQDETITSKAVAQMDNPLGKWRPGSYVQVNISTDEIPAKLVIAKEAVQDIDGESIVFVRMSEGFEKRAIKVGRNDTGNIEVLAGLGLGEQYAASNTFLLKAELGKHDVEHGE